MLSGGTLMDEGAYGCIFTPPLSCKNKKKQKEVEEEEFDLSKIILTEYAKREDAVSELIRKIPLWKNYFVVSETMCEPAPLQTDNDLRTCPVLQQKPLSQFRLLFMPFGGDSLQVHRFSLSSFNFLSFAQHFLEAGAILNLFGIVHRDIHSGNILVDKEDVPRIIDFNLAIFTETDRLTNQLLHQYNYKLTQEPPDSTLVNAIKLGYNAKRVISSIVTKKPILKKIRSLFSISIQEMQEQLTSFYEKSKSIKQGEDAKWFKVYWRFIDSWAIGVNLVEMIHKLSLFPEFAPILKRAEPTLFPILRRLCAVNPLDRIDCVQALYQLNPNHFIIRKYAKSWLQKVGTT